MSYVKIYNDLKPHRCERCAAENSHELVTQTVMWLGEDEAYVRVTTICAECGHVDGWDMCEAVHADAPVPF